MPAPIATREHTSYAPTQPPTLGSSSKSHPAAPYEDPERFRSYVSNINFDFDAGEELFSQRTEVPCPCPSRVVPPEELQRRAKDYAPRRGTGFGKLGGIRSWERVDSSLNYVEENEWDEHDGEFEMGVEYGDEDEKMADDENEDEYSDVDDGYDDDDDGNGGDDSDDDEMPSVDHQASRQRSQTANRRSTHALVESINSEEERQPKSDELSSVMEVDSDESDSDGCSVVAPRKTPYQTAGSTQSNPLEIETDPDDNEPGDNMEVKSPGHIATAPSKNVIKRPDMSFLRFLKFSVDRSQPGPTNKLRKLTHPNEDDQSSIHTRRPASKGKTNNDFPARKRGFDRGFLTFLASRLQRPRVAAGGNGRLICFQEDGLRAIPRCTPASNVKRTNNDNEDGDVVFIARHKVSKRPSKSNNQSSPEEPAEPEDDENNGGDDGSEADRGAQCVEDAQDEQMGVDSCSEWGYESQDDLDDDDEALVTWVT